MENKKKGLGLQVKFSLGIILITVLVAAVAMAVGARTYWTSTTNHYNTVAYQTAEATMGLFTEEEIRSYADLVYRYNHGDATDEEIEAVKQSPRYNELWAQVDHLRSSMDANDIYISVFDLDVLENYTEEARQAGEWRPVYYILDSYYKPEEQFVLGGSGAIVPDFIPDTINAIRTGVHTDRLIISNWQFGYILTASYPVVYGGETVAFIAVEIPMLTLQSDIHTYVARTVMLTSLVLLVLLAVGITFLLRTLIKPIRLVSSEAVKFVESNNEISNLLSTVKTRDEVQTLGESLLQMEVDINEYIDNLTKVTAEKERIGAELNVATQIQADMLPRIFPAFPDRKEFDIYATMTPAKEVGGDFYDFFLIDENHIGLVMADVSGKGVPAALFMVIAKTLIKNQAQACDYSPAKVLEKVNEQLCEGNEADLFVTVWFAIMDIRTGKGLAANAGHEHPALRRADGSYELVVYRHSMAVATMEGIPFKEHEFELHPGDSLFVYTDGVAEATDAHNELFGTDRMIEALNKNPDATPKEILTTVKSSVDEFVGDAPQFDDITMLCFKYFGNDDAKKESV